MIAEALWDELTHEATGHTGTVRRRVRADSARSIFVGVHNPGASRVLILEIDGADVDPSALPETRSLRIERRRITVSTIELRIVLIANEMKEVFTPFVDDVVAAMCDATTDSDAVTALQERYWHWRHLLSGGPEGLSDRAIRGLFGELWSLRFVLAPQVGVPAAIRSWTGPLHLERDFHVGGLGLEVKTTIAPPPPAVTIASELQLATDGLERLVLIALELDEAHGVTGLTLNDLVGWIDEHAAHEASFFGDRLESAGYFPLHSPGYERYRFVVRQAGFFDVQSAFPRLIPSLLPSGIGRVSYRLLLAACEPWRLSQEDVAAAVSDAWAKG